MTARDEVAGAQDVTFAEALRVWLKIGVTSFGGPAAQIALMHKELVAERQWIPEAKYLRALNFCMLLPGPEAMQLATYAGWLLHGWRGGVAAGLAFVLPGAALMMVLSALYFQFGASPVLIAVFAGVKAAVLAIVIEALLRISRRALKLRSDWLLAAAAFAALFFFGVPFPLVILAAAIIGAIRARANGDLPEHGAAGKGGSFARAFATAILWLAIWLTPLGLAALLLGPDHVLVAEGVFFSKLALVTFGGAYAVLAYMAQAAVETFGWLTTGQMVDGLGLAETTPGPLILVTAFVGFLGAAQSGEGPPILLGLAGAVMTLWVTFAPCFLWIFTFAPFVEGLGRRPLIAGALAGITAAVVGVIFNLSLWFALHVAFAELRPVMLGPIDFDFPVAASFDVVAGFIFALACVMLFVLHRGVILTLLVAAIASLAIARFSL